MRTLFALAAVASIAIAAPAAAQEVGVYGAPSHYNTNGGFDQNNGPTGYGTNSYDNGAYGYGYDRDDGGRNGVVQGYGDRFGYNNGQDFGNGGSRGAGLGNGTVNSGNRGYGDRFGYGYQQFDNGYGVANPSGAIEGRAAATDDEFVPNRMHKRRPVMNQDDQDMGR